jgi:FKBP-type peptidyl-prolyl cis-trans isomerase FklB
MTRFFTFFPALLALLTFASPTQAQDAIKNITDEYNFLQENGQREGVKTTRSGLQYEILRSGNGKTPVLSSVVVTHYRGVTLGGKTFDSSYERGKPATFPLRGVVAGWTEALQLMKEGDKWKLYVPSKLAYGSDGKPPVIGPNELLIFDLELIEVKE